MINKKLIQAMKKRPIQTKLKAETNNSTLYLYGDVGGYSWEEDVIRLQDVKNQIVNMPKEHVTIHIDSYGGVATEGIAIRNLLMDYFDEIDVIVDGIAASSASVIALSGNLTMPEGSILMIHNPWTIAMGDKYDLAKEIKTLQSMENSYIDVYMQAFNGSRDELATLLDEETWLTAEEATTYGFANKSKQEEVVDNEVDLEAILSSVKAKAIEEIADEEEIEDDVPTNDNVTTVDEEDDEKEVDKPKSRLSLFARNLTKL